LKDPNAFWDFLSLTPESVHQVTILFSDRGTPKSYRNMNGYGSHTFKWYNDKDEYFWVKYHFKTDQGIWNLKSEEAQELKGKDPDHATCDLYNAIAKGDYPSWTLQVQIMTLEQADNYRFDPFDVTKVWPHGDFPPMNIGRMVLNRNPENYFAEVEQVAFSPANFVPGIAASPDKLLQGRLFSYYDAHRYRLGSNYHLLPVNAPKAVKAENYQRDGEARSDANGGGEPNYYPNSFNGPEPTKEAAEPTFPVRGVAARKRYNHPNSDYVQAGDLYRKAMNDEDRAHLIANIVAHLSKARRDIQIRQTKIFLKADKEYGRRVAEGLGLKEADLS
jgi:catalase